MGEYEPNDSRNVTLSNSTAPGEPPRTGPREGETREEGEKGQRAAPQPGTTINEARGGPVEEGLVQPRDNPQATQSQWQGGQTQSMGGMSQTLGGLSSSAGQASEAAQAPSASHRSDARPQQMGDAQHSSAAPSQRESAGAAGAGWAADFPASEAEAASGHSIDNRQQMQEGDPDAERTRREQAAGQGGQDVPQGFGYGAEDGDEMADAPDASEPSERGYGGGGEQRLDKLNRDRS